MQRDAPKALASCFCFDPQSLKWSTLAPMRTPRLMHSMVALDGRLYAMGGQDSNDRSPGFILSFIFCRVTIIKRKSANEHETLM